MPKKKVFVARNLKDCIPNLPLRTGKAKKKVFSPRQFCGSLISALSYVFFLPILKILDNNPATMGSNGWGPMERHKVYSVVGRNTDISL